MKSFEGGPQPVSPEDLDRALDPGLEEDPDIFVELIDRTFYQLSCDDAMVAIIADYPGLLPASQVRENRSPNFREGSPLCALPTAQILRFTGKAIGAPCRTRRDSSTRGTEAR